MAGLLSCGSDYQTPTFVINWEFRDLEKWCLSKDKTLFSSEVLPLPRVFGSFAFSREAVLQGACLSTGCREGTAREGSECLRREFGGCLEEPLDHALLYCSWCVLSKRLLLHRAPWALFTMQVLELVCNPIGTCSSERTCACLCVWGVFKCLFK